MWDLKNKKVTIVGAARSGLAAAEVVVRLGGVAKISDSRNMVSLPSVLSGIAIEDKGHTKAFIQDSDFVVISPGVHLDSPPVLWAKEKKIEVIGEIEFGYRLCPCPIAAVTGSNGKTTTSTLLAEILKKSGQHVELCGNIGRPFSSVLLSLKPTDWVVLEISSFQLESTIHFKPKLGLWLNFSENHLDRHKDLEEYYDAKKKIFSNQDENDYAVLNFQQSEFHELAGSLKSQITFFDAPNSPRDISNPNHLAAMCAAEALGIPATICREVFSEFKGVEHRLEFVRHLNGVDYVNDSKSTTAKAGRWALQCAQKPVVLICGGSDKKIDYSELKPLVAEKVKNVIAIGQIQGQIKETFADVVPLETSNTFKEAILRAQQLAEPGDCVLLSPMTASFDMFKDYEHRGVVFKEMVGALS